MSNKAEVTMTLTRSTKGTHVYDASNEEGKAIVPTVYVKKDALPSDAPKTITLTLTWS